MSITVAIDRIVLDDAALVPGRAEPLAPLVAAEVRMLLERGMPTAERAERERVRARPLAVTPETDRELARELAERVVESLGGAP